MFLPAANKALYDNRLSCADMKFLYPALLALFSAATLPAAAQSLNEKGCATRTTPEEIQRIYDFVQHNPAAHYQRKGTDAVDTLPLSIHIVGTDEGTGYYSLDNLLKVICKLNVHFEPAALYFAVQWPIQYINNSTYYEHNYYEGASMMLENNVPNTINVYFVKDPSGACGYYTGWGDAVAIANSCAAPNSTTLVHELGHFLSLPHTFYGWEGGTPPPNPEKVTRGPGANCNTAGDGFCDTDADYIAERWYCPYTGTQTDQDGVPYHPDSSLYMSYALDACMSRFSNMQIAAMHYNIQTERPDLYPGPFIAYSELDTPVIANPVDTMYANYQMLQWHPVPFANQYRVAVAPKLSPYLTRMEVITGDTSVPVTFTMNPGITYQVRVEPLSSVNVCRKNALVHNFIFSGNDAPLSISQTAGLETKLMLSPNPVAGSAVQLQTEGFAAGNYQVAVLALNGQTMYQTMLQHPGGYKTITLPLSQLGSGMYFVRVQGKHGVWAEKLVVQ